MSIVNITDRERELENALAEEQRLNGMGAEREYVLRGKIERLERELGQAANTIQATAMERDALKAQLGDLPESQAEMLCEIKVLRNALESYANQSNWNEDFHGVRRWWLEPGSSTRKAGYDLASAALASEMLIEAALSASAAGLLSGTTNWAKHVKQKLLVEQPTMPAVGNTTCNPHPDAPHGFNHSASHLKGRYVCKCEGWMPPKMYGEQCLVCQSQQIDKLQAAAQLGLDAFDKMTGRKPEFVEQAIAALRQALK